jgi:hypothetical protein
MEQTDLLIRSRKGKESNQQGLENAQIIFELYLTLYV